MEGFKSRIDNNIFKKISREQALDYRTKVFWKYGKNTKLKNLDMKFDQSKKEFRKEFNGIFPRTGKVDPQGGKVNRAVHKHVDHNYIFHTGSSLFNGLIDSSRAVSLISAIQSKIESSGTGEVGAEKVGITRLTGDISVAGRSTIDKTMETPISNVQRTEKG